MSDPAETTARLQKRREDVTRAWDLDRGIVLIAAGSPLPIDGTDQFHDFHAHAEHYYLSGLSHPGGVLAFEPNGGWTMFAKQLDLEDQVWTNASETLEEQSRRSGLSKLRWRSDLAGWLEVRRGEPVALIGNHDLTHQPAAYEVPNWLALELDIDEALGARLSESVAEMRRAKSAGELALMREAARASVAGHLVGIRAAQAGISERGLQIEIEAEFFREGGERTAYGSIVGSGSNGSILHFAPTQRVVRNGDMILVDAGAQVAGYAADITRTYPVSGQFSPEQREIYDLVLATQQTAIDTAGPGVEYKALHMAASLQIASGLVDLGILRGEPQALVEQDAHALFFPHGLGHMLGLATHDAGGCLAGREPSDRFGLKWLRADLPLEENYVVTIEPGIYFIRALLTDAGRRAQYREAVNWERIDTMLDFGGIRIEDDVVVTHDGVELLSAALPRSAAAMEELRREALET